MLAAEMIVSPGKGCSSSNGWSGNEETLWRNEAIYEEIVRVTTLNRPRNDVRGN